MKRIRATSLAAIVAGFVFVLAAGFFTPLFSAPMPAVASPTPVPSASPSVAAAASAAPSPTPAPLPTSERTWLDRSLAPQKRAELLVQKMTLDEKVLEIHMMDVREHPREVPGIDRLGIPTLRVTNGSVGAGPGDTRDRQPATALPSSLALAASWDRDLAATYGEIAAGEAALRGDSLIEGPGLNIARVPQNGRNFEYLGEDPYLAARLVVPEIQAMQRQNIIVEPKHYAANNQEADRKTINEIIDERTLREIYLPAFEAAVKEGEPGAMMCAYPSVNGQFGCENVHMLKEILRGEWGFKGFVQSDYTATHSTIPAALAGLDLAMKHDSHYDADMKAAIVNGKLPESVLDTMLIRRFGQMFRSGLFDGPRRPQPLPGEKNGAISRSIAIQSSVLLKNSGSLLPLKPEAIRSIAVIGPYAVAALTGGGGSSEVTPLYTIAPADGVKKHVGTSVTVTPIDGADVAAASALAAKSDVALVMAGVRDREGKDRPNLLLPENQNQLIASVAAANPHTVVVLKTGGPVLMPWLDKVAAVLEAWYPGEEDGNVVADLLFGAANFSGKLPVTFPKAENDTPAHTPERYPGVNGTALYSEGLQVGYRWYDAQKIAPLFPFGYGLSYTTFSFHNLSVTPASVSIQAGLAQLAQENQIKVSVDVTNTGSRAGSEIVQVYVSAPSAAGEPPKQLKGFAKVTLDPGQTRQVTVALDPRAFSVWNNSAKQWTVFPGEYGLLVGDSSADLPLKSKITVGGLERR